MDELATVHQLHQQSYPAGAALPRSSSASAGVPFLPARSTVHLVTPDERDDVLQTPFARHLLGQGRADRTATEYARVIRRADTWIRFHHGHQLEQASPFQVREWADGLAPSWATRKQARTALRHWQEWCCHPHDLAAAVRVPRKPKMRPRALPDDQAARLEQAAHASGRRGLAVLLGLYLGMRCSEIAAACWTSYDGREFEFTRAKTGDIARLPVHPRLGAALDATDRWGPWMFPAVATARRPHVAPQTVWEWVRRIGAEVDVDVSTHQLRHTCITRIVDTMGIRVGQEWAGHRDPEVTAGYSMVPQRRLAEAMGQLSWGVDGDVA